MNAFCPILKTIQIPVGASLLAKAVCQSMQLCLIDRFREQARSHMGICVVFKRWVHNNNKNRRIRG
ncbi:hypothetical protein C0J26_16810 [Pseudomonas baetica]|nr:hypothetical protein C0J26_16810 [Pseudomonas baetica]